MLPFECVIQGVPVSLQTRNTFVLNLWKRKVSEAAIKAWTGGPPTNQYVKLTIVNFYDDATIDVDNMIKPIQDALKGIVYVEDQQVFDVYASKRDVVTAILVEASDLLAQTLRIAQAKKRKVSKDFVYIRVELINDARMLGL